MTALVASRPNLADRRWTEPLFALGLSIFAMLALFASDVADMAGLWWNVSTYGHCLFILPIAGWLVFQRLPELDGYVPQFWWPGLFAVFGAGSLWMLGEAGGIALFRHAAIVFAIQALCMTLLGLRLCRALCFPIFYLIFLIPAGEELVPPLQTITAEITIWLMGISNIPHSVNGVFITIPNGYFEVAEACSGVKFLIAMIAYGALVANVCFKSWSRRIAFMVAAIIVPILANGFRAFGTIWMAWAVDRDFAKGFDHIVYGWVFFAIVVALLMAMGWRFFDRKPGDKWLSGEATRVEPASHPALVGAMAALVALFLPVAWQSAVAASSETSLPRQISLPEIRGWERVPFKQSYPWKPHFAGADHMLHGTYRNKAGENVELAFAVFAWQEEGREMVGYGQGARHPESRWAWSAQTAKPRHGFAERITAPGPVNREVATIYVMGDKVTGSASAVKIETLKRRLIGGDQWAVAILASAEGQGRRAMDQLMADLGPPEKLAGHLVDQARAR